MLEIRTAQVLSLQGAELAAYIEDALPVIRECWPHLQHTEDDELRARLHRQAHAAFAAGLRSRSEWLRWLNVAIALGDEFVSQPRAAAILRAHTPPGARLERLVRWAETTLRGG